MTVLLFLAAWAALSSLALGAYGLGSAHRRRTDLAWAARFRAQLDDVYIMVAAVDGSTVIDLSAFGLWCASVNTDDLPTHDLIAPGAIVTVGRRSETPEPCGSPPPPP